MPDVERSRDADAEGVGHYGDAMSPGLDVAGNGDTARRNARTTRKCRGLGQAGRDAAEKTGWIGGRPPSNDDAWSTV